MSKSSEFLSFERFINKEYAESLADLLISNGIPARVKDNRQFFDVTFANNEVDADFHVEIPGDQFDEATKILQRVYEDDLDHLPEDYYLFSFSDKELFEVIKESDRWNKMDVGLSKILLRKRGHNIDEEIFEKINAKRLDELSQPETADLPFILLGYACSALVFIFNYYAFGLGMTVGVSLYFRSKILPSGKKVPFYDQTSRKHALAILLLNLVLWLISVGIGFSSRDLNQLF